MSKPGFFAHPIYKYAIPKMSPPLNLQFLISKSQSLTPNLQSQISNLHPSPLNNPSRIESLNPPQQTVFKRNASTLIRSKQTHESPLLLPTVCFVPCAFCPSPLSFVL